MRVEVSLHLRADGAIVAGGERHLDAVPPRGAGQRHLDGSPGACGGLFDRLVQPLAVVRELTTECAHNCVPGSASGAEASRLGGGMSGALEGECRQACENAHRKKLHARKYAGPSCGDIQGNVSCEGVNAERASPRHAAVSSVDWLTSYVAAVASRRGSLLNRSKSTFVNDQAFWTDVIGATNNRGKRVEPMRYS